MNLPITEGWTFLAPTGKTEKWLPAEVPGCVHLDLRRNKLIPEPFWGSNEWELQWIERRDWEYRVAFTVNEDLLENEHVDLVAGGLDTLATIIVNGHEIARTENMFTGWRFPVKDRLREGRNELRIQFANPMSYIERLKPKDFLREWNDLVGGCSVIRKEQCSFGWDWGPRFATCGIYKEIGLHGWSVNRIDSVRVAQEHAKGSVTVRATPALALRSKKARFRTRITLKGALVAEADGLELKVKQPQLWWPNTLGAQPLYDLEVELLDEEGEVLDKWKRRIGLRTIQLDRHADEWGESFQFLVNGIPVFGKGANWIPAHSFVTAAVRALYDDLLTSAAKANMNMIRVWGGGIYEMEDFYDLCDEKGLLVWQDFMFACALYPGTPAFLSLVKQEAEYQVKRLAHRACLSLWCGNNELEQMPNEIVKTAARKRAYETVFYKVLPEAVAAHDGVTPYWPSSPHNPEGYEKGCNNERAGDSHFWDVWHARHPVKRYEEKNFRFCSEFGMQSYSSPEVAATFCPPEEFNVFGPAMENHQKNAAGNQIILDYVSRLYRFPKDYASLAYLSQLNQAYCMKIGVEHFRRSMPRTMGALYWQLNDCWPVFSWSSIEFGGKWKALHYEAKRFFAPALVSAHVPGVETLKGNNQVSSTIRDVHLYTVYDAIAPAKGTLRWALYHLDNRLLEEGSKQVALRYGQSVKQKSLNLGPQIGEYGSRNLYLRVWLEIGGEIASRQTVFLTAQKYLNFTDAPIRTDIKAITPREFEISLASKGFHHQVELSLGGVKHRATDNYFDLYPGVGHSVKVTFSEDQTVGPLRSKLAAKSLVHSYAGR